MRMKNGWYSGGGVLAKLGGFLSPVHSLEMGWRVTCVVTSPARTRARAPTGTTCFWSSHSTATNSRSGASTLTPAFSSSATAFASIAFHASEPPLYPAPGPACTPLRTKTSARLHSAWRSPSIPGPDGRFAPSRRAELEPRPGSPSGGRHADAVVRRHERLRGPGHGRRGTLRGGDLVGGETARRELA